MKRLIIATVSILALPAVASAAPYLPTYGSPNSVQHHLVSSAMNLSEFDIEGAGRFDIEGDANVIGGALTQWEGQGVDGQRYEVRYQKAWRPFEGQRTRALLDAPINVISVDGHTATTFALSGGLEFPVTENWSLTPRVGYGVASASNYFGGSGEVASVSVSSRYRVPQVGRGDLVIGNSVAYTDTTDLLTDNPFPVQSENVVFRNGVAYQFPMQMMVFGRQSSMRASFTHTDISGDQNFIEHYNELSVNVGVRNREGEARNRFDLLRFGLMYTFGDDTLGGDYKSATASIGYRF